MTFMHWFRRRAVLLVGAVPLVPFVLVACGSAPDASARDASTASTVDAPGLDATNLDAPSVDGPSTDAQAADASSSPPHYGTDGPSPVGHVRFTMTDRTGQRTLPVEIWYPAQEFARSAAQAGVGLETLEPDGSSERAILAPLVAAAPATCTRKMVHSVAGAPPALPPSGLWPLVIFSHCLGCVRFSEAVVAERLASYGIAMAAPDP
jgi:hypothetical protein